MKDKAGFGGTFEIRCVKPDGTERWSHKFDNMVFNGGLNSILNTYFRQGSPAAAFYFGVVDNTGFTTFAAGDTIGSHTGWSEFTGYSESTRQQWNPDASTAQSLSNSTEATFTLSGGSGTTYNIRGLFICSDNTKGGTSTGVLVCGGAFSTGVLTGHGGDQLKTTYTFNGASNT